MQGALSILNHEVIIQLIRQAIMNGMRWTLLYLAGLTLYRLLNLHERWGFFGMKEPNIHLMTAIKNVKFPFLWGIGMTFISYAIGLNLHKVSVSGTPALTYSVPDSWIFLPRFGMFTDILYAVIGYYLMDFVDYWSHRLNHQSAYLYNRFPFGHFVHHNYIFLNPMVIPGAPPIHLALIASMLVYVLMLTQGLILSVLLIHVTKLFASNVGHLGFDPIPALTRLNRKIGGFLPWIPLHHQYHHIPFVTYGNYGNMSMFWDHIFGTLIPECEYHIQHGYPMARVSEKFRNANVVLEEFLVDKTQLSLK